MNKRLFVIIGFLVAVACLWTACKDDSASAGSAVLSPEDAVVVLVDTFPLSSQIENWQSIHSQADSFLLGEIETDYGLLRASILTQLACPEGFSYPANATIDSICLFIYYGSWVGDPKSPLAIDAYLMDKKTFRYANTYMTDLNIDDYCSRDKSILTNHRIVAADEKMDSIQDESGKYIPVLRMRVNDDFMDYFWSIKTFKDQDSFNEAFKGILFESSFGSSTILNISDLALGVFYSFSYQKAERDTVVSDMKIFYANSEVRTVNHMAYTDKAEWIETLKQDSDTYNYIIAPACVYTRVVFPLGRITDSIMGHMTEIIDGETDTIRRPYVNKAEVRIDVTNVYKGSASNKERNDWLQPASYMLLIKESSMERFFANKELPTDTCALLSSLIQTTGTSGESLYYYTYDLSDFITNQLRQQTDIEELRMMLVPVSLNAASSSTSVSSYSSVRQQETMSVTQIESAKNGTQFEIVYSGFTLPLEH